MKATAVEWLLDWMGKNQYFIGNDLLKAVEQAKEMECYKAKVEAKKYYLKGFEDAELTENQGCSHEQTMRDAESFFELVYPLNTEK
jgi:hypothetical protein